MGFVKSSSEIGRMREVLREARFVGGEMLSATYRTHPEAVARILPPGLEPIEEPLARLVVGRWRSNAVGDFHGGALYVPARHRGVAADYVVSMFMDRDVPLLYGRELYGEPKKIARVNLARQQHRVTGWIERGGVRIIEIDALLGPDTGPSAETAGNFNIKAMLAADGQALVGDAQITHVAFESVTHVRRLFVESEVVVRGTAHDPLDELPVVEVVAGSYGEGDMRGTCTVVGSIGAEAFYPYALGRLDDYAHPDLDTESTALSSS